MSRKRLSLDRRVEQLRELYTSEHLGVLKAAVANGMHAPNVDRQAILHHLDTGYETRLLGENPEPAATGHLRNAVLADAAHRAQQELEAGILLALGNLNPLLKPIGDGPGRRPVCHKVSPAVDGPAVHLRMGLPMIAAMTALLLPGVVSGIQVGLAGLRWRLHRRHVELYLADADVPTSVKLDATSPPQWMACLAFAKAVNGHEWPAEHTGPLTDAERADIAAGRVPGQVLLASALLRRLRVFGDTAWLEIQLAGPDGIHVFWAGGRSPAEVAVALVHPLSGVPGDRVFVAPSAVDAVTITVMGHGDNPARLVLQQPLAGTRPQVSRFDGAAWAAFDRVLSAPKPSAAADQQ